MSVDIDGDKETISNLSNMAEKLGNMKLAMQQVTMLLTRSARINAPVDRGILRASITPDIVERTQSVVGSVGTPLVYGAVMELGSTKRWWPPISALQPWARRHGISAFLVARAISRRGLKARRYLQRALESNMPKIIQIFNDEVQKIIR